MLRIGEFSRRGRVSVKALRHYEAIGLLKPAHVDAATGYRSYAEDQLDDLHRLMVLRALGLSLERIRQVLQDDPSPERMRRLLDERAQHHQPVQVVELVRRVGAIARRGVDMSWPQEADRLVVAQRLDRHAAAAGKFTDPEHHGQTVASPLTGESSRSNSDHLPCFRAGADGATGPNRLLFYFL